MLDLSDYFFESYASFCDNTTRARTWESLEHLLDHLPEGRRLLLLFRGMELTCSDVDSLFYFHSLILVSIYPLKSGHDEVE